MRESVNRIFGTNFTATGMKAYYTNHKIKAGKRKKIYTDVFPEEICDYIRKNCKGITHKEMAARLMQQFGRKYTDKQITAYYKNHHIKSGLTGRFEKGHEPMNKGRKIEEFMSQEAIERSKATRFQPGNTPHNHLPVGTIVRNTDGYYRKKLAEPDVWKQMQVLTWEENFGPVPEDMLINFKDGDTSHWNVENLMLVSRAEHAVMNRLSLRSEHPELTEVGLMIAKVKVAQGKRKHRRRKESNE